MGALVGLLILAVIIAGIVGMVMSRQNAERAEQERKLREREEEERVKGCGEVVLFFANHLGYIARQVIDRGELAELIDSGISSDGLGQEICKRIEAVDGQVLGYQSLADARVPVKLTQDYRDRHVYIIGKSGAGKTNLLRNLIAQDLEAGHGLGVLAPEAEMLNEEILPFIPDHRIDDVIYFNPADTECPVCFNPLQVEDGEDVDLKVDENLTVFKRLMGETGPRMEEILRQALYALTGRPGATLLDLERLLDPTDAGFRSEVVRTCRDEAVAHYWQDVYPTMPKDAHLPITNRLGRLLRPKSIRSILCRPQSSISFQQAMDSGKVMLFNLSDGLLGEQNSQLLGQLVVSKFQLTVMARARQPKTQRRNFYLYLDEFQTFVGSAGASYEKILSRARKYKLGLILAHQQTGQVGTDLLKEILGNVSTTICFPVSREDALRFSKEFVTEYDGQVLNVPEEEILRLKVGQAWCRMGQHAFKMHTTLASQRPSAKRARYIEERARGNYGRALPAAAAADKDGNVMPERAGERAAAANALDDLDPGSVFGK